MSKHSPSTVGRYPTDQTCRSTSNRIVKLRELFQSVEMFSFNWKTLQCVRKPELVIPVLASMLHILYRSLQDSLHSAAAVMVKKVDCSQGRYDIGSDDAGVERGRGLCLENACGEEESVIPPCIS